MSTSIRKQPDDRPIELGTEVNWAPIYAAIGVAVGACVAVFGLSLLSPVHPAPGDSQALSQPGPEPRERMPARAAEVAVVLPKAIAKSGPVPTAFRYAAVETVEPVHAPAAQVTEGPAAPGRGLKARVEIAEAVHAPTARAIEPSAAVARTPEPSPGKTSDAPLSAMKRYDWFVEDQYREMLLRAREIDLDTEKGTTQKLLAELKKTTPGERAKEGDGKAARPAAPSAAVLTLIAKRNDLKGLPVQNEADCRVDAKDAGLMAEVSRPVRRLLGRARRNQDPEEMNDVSRAMDMELAKSIDRSVPARLTQTEVGARTIAQMLQVETVPLRLHMVNVLAATKGKATSVALARRAAFDVSWDVRAAAVLALKDRPAVEYRSELVELLRYPWPAAADHAAEALVNLRDREVVPVLVDLLDKPDPRAPVQDKDKKWHVAELVRVNHFGNCLLCHAPCSATEKTVRGLVPTRGERIPEAYYEGRYGNFVRADVTYLRQDFSVMLPVKDPGKWPQQQRFDFLVRQRELTPDEVAHLKPSEAAAMPALYPQRESVLWALRELTGTNGGSLSESWRTVLRK